MKTEQLNAAREAASPWRDRRGAGAYLRLDERSVDDYRRKGLLPAKYHGRKPVYKVEDLDKLPAKEAPRKDEEAA